jgi:filamentous hemagglutinin family protein
MIMKCVRKLYLLGLSVLLVPNNVSAQIVVDKTMGTFLIQDTLLNGNKVDGGLIRGNNLFHSFGEFSIDAGSSVYFINPTNVTNILTRVTGGNPSSINGTLGVLGGNANLFFMNPNGVIFGTNAKLDVNGSFLATTASSINFADGTKFSVDNVQVNPLLTVSSIVGLGFGSNPGRINVNGSGHNLTATDPSFAPYINRTTNPGLRVAPGKTLALLGGQLNLNGGILTAERGKVELGSIAGYGTVDIANNMDRLNINYDKILNFGDISFERGSLVDASGTNGSSIQIIGRAINLKEGSVILLQNRGTQKTGDITVKATESLLLDGTSNNGLIRTSLTTETLAGNSGNVNVDTKRLIIQNGSGIGSRTFSQSSSGNVYLNATESFEIKGFSPINSQVFSAVASISFANGNSGSVNVTTPNLSLLDGGIISGTTFGKGSAGNLNIDAKKVEIAGFSPGLFTSSAITSSSLGDGNSGDITINTDTMRISRSGTINTTANSRGSSGNILVNAKKSVEVDGVLTLFGTKTDSDITSNVNSASQTLRQLFKLPEQPSGNAGNVSINTPNLKVTNGASIGVRNFALGNGGSLKINANYILLDRQGRMVADTNIGKGGDIIVRSQNLQLRNNSLISTDSRGNKIGGNITINTNTLVALSDSDITANSRNNFGGQVIINAQGIFGTQYRDKISSESDITASSDLGASFSGTVNIITLDINQQNNLKEQSVSFKNIDNILASSCLADRNSQLGRFAVIGNGGIPYAPTNGAIEYYLVQMHKVINNAQNNSQNISAVGQASTTSAWKLGDPINEATELITTKDGKLLLQARSTDYLSTQQTKC